MPFMGFCNYLILFRITNEEQKGKFVCCKMQHMIFYLYEIYRYIERKILMH